MNTAEINMCECVSPLDADFDSFGFASKSGTAGSYGSYVFSF
jgi:hypothetical protein